MRPNDDFLDQIIDLDNENQRRIALKETPLLDTLPKLRDLPDLPKPWHYEFWKTVPDASEVPFKLRHIHEKLDDNLDESIALLNPAALTCCQNASTETVTKKNDETVTKSFSSFNLSQMELACSNPFKMSQTMFSNSVKVQRRSPSISEEESSWEYYSYSESEME